MVRGVQSLFSKSWPKPGNLHVYALPDDHLRDLIVGSRSIMDETDQHVADGIFDWEPVADFALAG